MVMRLRSDQTHWWWLCHSWMLSRRQDQLGLRAPWAWAEGWVWQGGGLQRWCAGCHVMAFSVYAVTRLSWVSQHLSARGQQLETKTNMGLKPSTQTGNACSFSCRDQSHQHSLVLGTLSLPFWRWQTEGGRSLHLDLRRIPFVLKNRRDLKMEYKEVRKSTKGTGGNSSGWKTLSWSKHPLII